MKFKYRKIFVGSSKAFPQRTFVLRPIIPISIIHKKKSLRYEALVDSGSDYTLFPAALGKKLGINIESGQKESVSGVSGPALNIYFHHLVVEMGDYQFKVYAGFAENINQNFAILGQSSFFNVFKITFNSKKKEVEIIPSFLPGI